MRWRYLEDGREQGPVEEEALRLLMGQGRIHLETQVSPEDLKQWRPYREAIGAPLFECHECGKSFSAEEMIRFGEDWVCAACKPAFIQKLREGIGQEPGLPYAGFWVRVAATILDGFLLYAVNIAVGLAFGRTFSQIFGLEPEKSLERTFGFMGISLALGLIYETYLVGRFGGTVGKMCCGIRVVNDEGQPISYLRSAARYLAKQLNGATLGIGYIMAAFDAQKRGLHDHICTTRVIFRSGRA